MLGQHPDTYRGYMEGTGMFLPNGLERSIAFSTLAGKVSLFVLVSVCAIGGAFVLRAYTVRHLPLWTGSNVTALAVLPEDEPMMQHRMSAILSVEPVRSRLN